MTPPHMTRQSRREGEGSSQSRPVSESVPLSAREAGGSGGCSVERPITMQDVRLAVGEGRLTPSDVLAGCNAELARRASLCAREVECPFCRLAISAEECGSQHCPKKSTPNDIDYPTPLGALRFRMEQGGHTQADLAKLIGSRSHAAEILAGKRSLSKTHIRHLSDEWGIPARSLLGPAKRSPSGVQGSEANTSQDGQLRDAPNPLPNPTLDERR